MPITLRARPPHAEPTSKPPRPRLAPNVICLFPETLPPVVNPRHRGPYPRSIVLLRRWPRIRPGVICEMVNKSHPENLGKLVCVVEETGDNEWRIKSLDGGLRIHGEGPAKYLEVATAYSQNLRRVWDR